MKNDTYKASWDRYNLCKSCGANPQGQLFDNLPEIMKPKEAAKLLGISVKTIYDWKYRGQMRDIPRDLFLKINGSLYIRTEVLKRLIASN